MKSRLHHIITLSFLLLVTCPLPNCANAQIPSAGADQPASSNMFVIDGANNALFSPSGRFLAVQFPFRFKVLIIDSLFNYGKKPSGFKEFPGRVIGFFPPEKCIIGAPKGTFELDLSSLSVRQLDDSDLTKPYSDYSAVNRQMIPLGDSTLLYGLGDCDPERTGRIFELSLDGKTDTINAPIGEFRDGFISPDQKYVLFRCGCGNRQTTCLLDVRSQEAHSLEQYLSESESTLQINDYFQTPLGWIPGADLCLVQLTGVIGADTTYSMLMIDVPNRKPVWQTKIAIPVTQFTLLDDRTALVANNHSALQVEFDKGIVKSSPLIPSAPFGVSPDRNLVAYIADSSVYVVPADGGQTRKVATIRDLRLARTPDGYGFRSLLWSSQNNALVVFDERRAILIKVD